jgi:hypothetical protein
MGSISILHWVILLIVLVMFASPLIGIIRAVKNRAIAHAILSAFIPVYGLIYFFAAARPASAKGRAVASDPATEPF